MDIVVALDSSADVSSLQWAHQKQFVRNILESFAMSEDSSHVGVVAYSTIPSIQSKLDERNNHDDVIKSIQVLLLANINYYQYIELQSLLKLLAQQRISSHVVNLTRKDMVLPCSICQYKAIFRANSSNSRHTITSFWEKARIEHWEN